MSQWLVARLSVFYRIHFEFAFRRCGADGVWAGRRHNDLSPTGWTNYTPCFSPLVQSLFYKVYNNEGNAQDKMQIARTTRTIEITAYLCSFTTLLVALAIFIRYKTLRNTRTTIHVHLYLATLLEAASRLILYIDQELIRNGNNMTHTQINGIDNMPFLCESIYTLLEYCISLMFSWMLIEGIVLNYIVTNGALRAENISLVTLAASGWMAPGVTIIVWATLSAVHSAQENHPPCWYGYNFRPLFIILQIPRYLVIMINVCFLINIVRTVMNKLNRTVNSDIEKIKKALKAMFILMPLLGVTNTFALFDPPLNGSTLQFAMWCYVSHFLRSSQGVFISIIYCFNNAEVQNVIKNEWNKWRASRAQPRRRTDDIEMNTLRQNPVGGPSVNM